MVKSTGPKTKKVAFKEDSKINRSTSCPCINGPSVGLNSISNTTTSPGTNFSASRAPNRSQSLPYSSLRSRINIFKYIRLVSSTSVYARIYRHSDEESEESGYELGALELEYHLKRSEGYTPSNNLDTTVSYI
jgi:hypothetical protein